MTIQSISYGAVQTAYVSYTSYDLDVANSILTFVWPTPYATSPNVLAATTNFVVTETGCEVNFPNANEVSLGMNIFIRNDGSSNNDVTINDNLGNPIETINPGEVWWIQLTAYTNDSAGIWIPIQQGAGTSQATAADLAGKGLEAVATRLNTVIPPKTITANYTIVGADQSGLILINSTGLVTINLGAFRGGFSVSFNNIGTGDVFFTGTVNNSTTFSLGSSQTVTLINDAIDTTKWWTLGLGQGTSFLDSVVSIDLTDIAAAGGTLVLSASQLNAFIQQFYSDDPITGNIVIYYGNNSGNWYVANFCSTTNGSTISLSLGSPATPVGAPIVVPMGAKLIYYAANDPTTNQLSLFTIPSILSLQRLLLADGTAAAPSLSFSSDETSGVYLNAAFKPSISAQSTQIATFDGTTPADPRILVNPGTSDYPSYSFDADLNFGMGLVNPGALGFFGNNAIAANTLVTTGTTTTSNFIAPTSGNTLILSIDNTSTQIQTTIGAATTKLSMLAAGTTGTWNYSANGNNFIVDTGGGASTSSTYTAVTSGNTTALSINSTNSSLSTKIGSFTSSFQATTSGSSGTWTFQSGGTPSTVLLNDSNGCTITSNNLSFPSTLNLNGSGTNSTITLNTPFSPSIGSAYLGIYNLYGVNLGYSNGANGAVLAISGGTTTSTLSIGPTQGSATAFSVNTSATNASLRWNNIPSIVLDVTGAVTFSNRQGSLNNIMPVAPGVGSIAWWDGTNWVATTAPTGNPQVLTWDGATVAWA